MRFLYTLLLYCAMPFIILRLLWRSKRLPAYRKRWTERFACLPETPKPNGLWIHAVSFGESVVAIPLIKQLQQKHPTLPITVTNMTPTGSEKIRSTFGSQVANFYIPYDLPCLMKKFIKKVQPKLVVIMETELWPNMLLQCQKHDIPVVLANGRLSARSAVRYKRVKPLMQRVLSAMTTLLVQTEAEAERYVQLGCEAKKIQVTGSIKFDIQPPEGIAEQAKQLRKVLGADRLIFIAASTHAGEEKLILQAFKEVKKLVPDLLLLLVPRHPDRFQEVEKHCQQAGFSLVKRSENSVCEKNTDIYLGDSMGELFLFYAVADLAFVGGSLVPVGGHNVLEPAVLGKAILTGPHMRNFLQITKLLLDAKGIKQVQNLEDLIKNMVQLLQLPGLRKEMGEHAQQVVANNQGAMAKHLAVIEKFF